MNVAEIELKLSELVAEPFDGAEFPFAFAEIYHAPKATLTKLRNSQDGKQDLFGGFLWKKKYYFQPADSGQSAETLEELKARKFARTESPRFLISTDGAEFSAFDTKADESVHCAYGELNDNFDFFLPLAGIEKFEAIEENPADIKAAGRLAKFHDEIIRANPEWADEGKRHELNLFMTRILFCMYAEDTGIIPENLFSKTVTEWGGPDGSSLRIVLKQIFDVMNVAESDRDGGATHINAFPFVNGGLFADQTEVPTFSKRATRYMLEASELDWREINPDIFGSMIQAVVDEEMRGDLGMHYTSVPNIMKVLQPLFLMSLEEELAEAHGHREERSMLKKLRNRISKIRVFDPACGSGNFLIIAYRELRQIEMRIFQREDELEGGQTKVRWESGIKLSNFFGIEYADFAAETAKLSLWIAEYQMNVRFKEMFGEAPSPLPLTEGGNIVHGNALRENWLEVCPPADDEEVETYLCGNPPYLGSTYQNAEQKRDMELVFSSFSSSYKNLDYVSAWYLKASDFINIAGGHAAFVATNSLCQGDSVGLLWPLIFSRNLEISFAHQSFPWRNLASKNAAVFCVIVGIRQRSNAAKLLFSDQIARRVKNIGPYLIEMPDIIVSKTRKPIQGFPTMDYGNKPTDGGNLILTPVEHEEIVEASPKASKFLRRLYGSQEIVKGIERWCVWINDSATDEAMQIPQIAKRVEAVRKFREESKAESTRDFAKFAYRFRQVQGNCDAEHVIVIPRVTTDRRKYLPVGLVSDQGIVLDSAFAIYEGSIAVFAILSSLMHITWVKAVCGKLKSDYRYSNTMGYNAFPLPKLEGRQLSELENIGWQILQERESHAGASLAWLYDPKTMPNGLKECHGLLDDTLEKIYIGRPFKDDTERLEHLFKMYAEMTAKNDKKKVRANA
ncbi:hypothetical protein B5C34_06445 [Pacificimonas flava]|uniref:site-specific DNA-methyltransferase (adenine-specific) n=2 Tax=Pacificimonas TaxID=1960290 RepID=A0A219B439_9SPHN|nr:MULTISPECIES: DNA methyltransferase [Pacificimonas]MBZ6377135.1 class I SAM-dependent DNA methyltransferase [Pacificimonas aurantium]OWV33140.1 hypothetical protein B5C34_06445 [Pacificimonas flava]|tara:strand:- start:1095 stop:3809 length:2715 start_codon:yes stop_codon:yes gene_type:complete